MQTEKRASSQGATWGLAILFGVVGASLQQSVAGFVIGAALGVLFAQVLHLRSRTETLDQQLRELKQRLAAFKAAPDEGATTPSVAPTTAAAPAPTPAPAAAAGAPPLPAPKPTVRTADLLSQPLPAAPPQPPRTPTAVDRAVAEFMAWLKRGNPLARIGIVILFFGAAFLAKYAGTTACSRSSCASSGWRSAHSRC